MYLHSRECPWRSSWHTFFAHLCVNIIVYVHVQPKMYDPALTKRWLHMWDTSSCRTMCASTVRLCLSVSNTLPSCKYPLRLHSLQLKPKLQIRTTVLVRAPADSWAKLWLSGWADATDDQYKCSVYFVERKANASLIFSLNCCFLALHSLSLTLCSF